MNAGQVIELAREWVEVQGSQIPGFCGAHLMGGLTYTPREAPFPNYKDVDMNIVLQGAQGWDVNDVFYKGLILEYGSVGIEAYRSPEAVLSDMQLASNLAANSILSDPTGMLASLHAVVAAEYPRRKWVRARVEDMKNKIRMALDELGRAAAPVEVLFRAGLLVVDLGGLVAVAGLKPPTHRRSLILMREVLGAWGQPDLQEETLAVFGCARLSRAQVESYLRECAAAFDRAVEVTRTPVPYSFKLHAFVRPYVVQAVEEMIAEGSHREAMLWTVAFLLFSNNAIQADAPEGEKPQYQAKIDRLAADMGWNTSKDIAGRVQWAKVLVEKVFKAADEIMSLNPEILD
jgi:hypothetical protein